MEMAIVCFADNSKLTLKEGDLLIPIVKITKNGKAFASMGEAIELYYHHHDGLIPSIMDVLCTCPFFYVGNNDSPAYCSHSVVKVENV